MLLEVALPARLLGRLRAARRRPVYLLLRRLRGTKRTRILVDDLSRDPREGYTRIPSPDLLLGAADLIKLYAPDRVRIFFPRSPSPDRRHLGTTALTYREGLPPIFTVAIVGCGRAGTEIAMALRKEGFEGRMILVDPDRVTARNLPPYWEAPGEPKVEALARFLRRGLRPPKVIAIPKPISLLDEGEKRLIIDCDWIFLAVDDWTARVDTNRLAMGFGIPATMLGVGIVPQGRGRRPPGYFGQIEIYLPFNRCLECLERPGPESERIEDDLRRIFWGIDRRTEYPSDPVLSGLLADGAVLLFRQALAGGRLHPRYEFALLDARVEAEVQTPPVRRGCEVCRPRGAAAPLLVPSLREGVERRQKFLLARVTARWAGALLAALAAEALGAAASLGLLLAISWMSGYASREYYSPLEYWLEFNSYWADTTLGNHFGLLVGALLWSFVPYLLLPWPIYVAGRVFQHVDTAFAARLLKSGLLRPIPLLRRDIDIASPRLPVGPRARRALEVAGQVLMGFSLSFGFFLVLPSFRALGIFWAFSLTFMFPFFVGAVLFYFTRWHMRAIVRSIRTVVGT